MATISPGSGKRCSECGFQWRGDDVTGISNAKPADPFGKALNRERYLSDR